MNEFLQEHPHLFTFAQGFSISFALYCIYLEVNPHIGGVFYRPDQNGNKRFNLKGVWPMLVYPFKTYHFWVPQNWDLNWIMTSTIGAGVYMYLRNLNSIRDYLFKD